MRRLTIALPTLLVALASAIGIASALAGEAGTGLAQTDEPTETGEVLQGRVNQRVEDENQPLAGVEITVTAVGGEEVATVETDAEGAWRVELPGPGRYEIMLNVETLPEGAELRNAEANPLTVPVRTGDSRTVLFPLGERTGGAQFFERVLGTVLNGVLFGLLIAMTAIGLSLIFGTTGLINFAHGELVTFGAIVAWYLNTAGPQLWLVNAGIIAVLAGGVLGVVFERGLFRPLRRRQVGLFQLLVITIGLSLLLRYVILLFFGGEPQPYADYAVQSQIDLGPLSLTPRDAVIIVASVVLLVAAGLMLQRTKIGKAMRAVSDDRDLAESSGIDVQRVILIVWLVGSALAALGGVFLGAVVDVDWLMGFRLLLLMFAGVILGGLGSPYGAMVGSLVVGIVTEVSVLWVAPELKYVWALAILILVLLVRPQGILGVRERLG